ncbi:hypothetical protein [Gordonia neofelifaecis]|uniref:Uncharacterized protein n=1 Tax=Gordonia neofelifaecis NRRL B-59395 TaxID=644548 RepID=F1YEV1_9ACTN|nr:hypothetical protein [Gordonia neofelifaecis]EGD56934.1 hypothetical protein SCNU_01110 [Gordonia neofelifaecis NRRL B-59395]
MTRRRLLIGALGVLVVSLILGSVYSTGAFWADAETWNPGTVETGTIGLDAHGSGGSSYTFPALQGANIAVGNVTEAPLTITNTGSTRIRYLLSAGGPMISTTGSAVTVRLSGSVGGCAGGSGDLSGAFPATDTTGPHTAIAPGSPSSSDWKVLEIGASTTWCVRAMLKAVSGTQPAAYQINFDFAVGQLRPGQNP